jgi:hypothetical protein
VQTPGTQSKFPLGQLVVTGGVACLMTTNPNFARFCTDSLYRHGSGDWGDLSEEDKAENELALKEGNLRLFSSYESDGLPTIWIITEADRSATATLFPDEY